MAKPGLYGVDVYSSSPRSYATLPETDFTIVKATQGTGYVNPYCDVDYQAAKKAGKLLGFYHYAGGGNPAAEARFFYQNTKNYNGEAVPALDWESYQNSAWGSHDWCLNFITEYFKLSGVYPLIYTSLNNGALAQVNNCAKYCGLWGAGYPTNAANWEEPDFIYPTGAWNTITIWQFSSSNGTMDRNIAYISVDGWKRLAGSRPAPTPAPAPKPTPAPYSPNGKNIETIANDVIAGKVGNGDERKKVLGNLYDAVQWVVENKYGNVSNDAMYKGLADEVTKGNLGNGGQRQSLLGNYYNAVQSIVDNQWKYYTVVPGDSFWLIACKLGVDMYKLAANNGMSITSVIHPGDRLKY